MGKADSHIKNSVELATFMDTITLDLNDDLLSLDVVSLFTHVPIEPTMKFLEPLLPQPVVKLFEYMLQSVYFMYNGAFHKQVDSTAMGSPLSSFIANFFMQPFEAQVLKETPLKPKLVFCGRYAVDMAA